jgi:xanthine dehydrogenase YagT iron-sulfur-binding subunit
MSGRSLASKTKCRGDLSCTPATCRPGAATARLDPAPPLHSQSRGRVAVQLTINGRVRQFDVDVRTILLDLPHERAGLTDSKKGCHRGRRSACTVPLEVRRISACAASR